VLGVGHPSWHGQSVAIELNFIVKLMTDAIGTDHRQLLPDQRMPAVMHRDKVRIAGRMW